MDLNSVVSDELNRWFTDRSAEPAHPVRSAFSGALPGSREGTPIFDTLVQELEFAPLTAANR